jgi:hypothetical protein
LRAKNERPSTTVRQGCWPWKISSASPNTGSGTHKAWLSRAAWAPAAVKIALM